MANQQHQQKLEHFSHKHPLTLVEADEEEENNVETPEYRSFLRCYGCTEKISAAGGGTVPYYRCEEEGCGFFCLHQSCANMPMTTTEDYHDESCDGILKLTKHLRSGHESSNGVVPDEHCKICTQRWYRFSYVCTECGSAIHIRCTWTRSEDKHPFHQHPVYPASLSPQEASNLLCSDCGLRISTIGTGGSTRCTPAYRWRPYADQEEIVCYRCHYCNYTVHPSCTPVPLERYSPHDDHPPHKLQLTYGAFAWDDCQICGEEIHTLKQWAHICAECDYWIHVYDCSNTIRKKKLTHFSHKHPLVLVEEALDNATDPIAQDSCRGCRQKITCGPYYTCEDCKTYHLHKLCADLLPSEMEHQIQHPGCTLKLLTNRPGMDRRCSLCTVECNGFAYHCSPCNFGIDIICALKALPLKKDFHLQHPLVLSLTKAPFSCHACDKDSEGISYQCNICQFWVHEQCASLPTVKKTSSHEHELKLIFSIPESLLAVDVYCQICRKYIKHHNWTYHCYQCRYFTHVYDCSNPHRDEVTINATANVINLPFPDEQILLTDETTIKHKRYSMILFADQFESNSIDVTPSFINLIQGSATWPTFHVEGKDYCGHTFSFYKGKLVMQITGLDLPHYVKHEAHPHVLESTFLKTSTWCNACEQSFFGCGFRCTTCAFTIDTYCVLLPRTIKHKHDEHPFPLTYSAIEDIEKYTCGICEEDVIPKWFYHCAERNQSIHARCIWQAYIKFERFYRFHPHRCPVTLVPPSKDLPQCIICDKQQTFGHGFAFLCIGCKFMVHLTCTFEDEVKISKNVEELSEEETEGSPNDEEISEDETEGSQNDEETSED